MSEPEACAVKRDICLGCGKVIVAQASTINLLGSPVVVRRQEYCLRCGYLNLMNAQMLCRRPYREPMPRIKKDGRLPDKFLRAAYEQGYRD